jgi:cell wall-associated NlpC family hydrolase
MASTGQIVRRFRDVRPGDLIFYDGSGDGVVDHVDLSIGGGWAIDSSGSAGGVTITNVTSGWYQDNFVRARRIIGAAVPAA